MKFPCPMAKPRPSFLEDFWDSDDDGWDDSDDETENA